MRIWEWSWRNGPALILLNGYIHLGDVNIHADDEYALNDLGGMVTLILLNRIFFTW